MGCWGVVIRVCFEISGGVERVFVLFLLAYRWVRWGYGFRRIALTKGMFAIVDAEDYDRLAQYSWTAQKGQRTYYATRRIRVGAAGKRKTIWMHREIVAVGAGLVVDHVNHDGLDNRKANLRAATPAENGRNRRKRRMASRSRYKGLSWSERDGRWYVRIHVDGKAKFLGAYADEVEGAKVYDSAARRYYGEFAATNF